MDQLLLLIAQNRALTLVLMAALSLGAAAVMGVWLKQGLKDGRTWMVGGGLWLKPARDQRPILFWTSITSQVALIALFALFGIAMFAWSLVAR